LVLKNNREVETCKEYDYLRTILNKERIDDQEINKRVTKAKRIIVYLNKVLWKASQKGENSIYMKQW